MSNPPIPEQLRRKGWTYTLVAPPVANWAIYRQTHPEISKEHFELVKLTWEEARRAFGKTLKSRWRYPSSEEWGTRGFTYDTLEQAEKKRATILAELKDVDISI